MELRHLRYFVMVAEEENISRAAARLNISQPAVSRQIHDLEDELGVVLFERERNGLSLTEAGHSALTHARQVLRQEKSLLQAMSHFAESETLLSLKVGYIPTALTGFLAEAMHQFNLQHNQVCVQIYEMSPLQQEKALRKREIDLALLGSACPGLKRDFRVQAIRKVAVAVALPEDHRLAGRKWIDLEELADDVFLSLHEKNFPGRREMMKEMCRRVGIDPKISIRAEGLSELLALVGAGSGVALVPADLDELQHARMVFVKLKRPKFTLVSSAVWRKEIETEGLLDLVALLQGGGEQRTAAAEAMARQDGRE